MPVTGMSIVAGQPTSDTSVRYESVHPATGTPSGQVYHAACPAEVDRAVEAAAGVFDAFAAVKPEARASFLDRCAGGIADLGDELVEMACSETGLAGLRIAGERDRTVNQFRFFASLVRDGVWVDAVIDRGDPGRQPIPRPDLRRMLRPLGPVAVFGASNFPLAYSAGGGDTASALAAGCPVVVKGHPSHPGTGELVARAISNAARDSGMPSGTYGFLHAGGTRELDVGRELVMHPAIRAAGFTGSPAGGMALANLGLSRPDPIPVFSEMGSVNPVFVLASAMEGQGASIATKLHASATNSGGQMCTCPGVVFIMRSAAADEFVRILGVMFAGTSSPVMLSHKIRDAYERRLGELAAWSIVWPGTGHSSGAGPEPHGPGSGQDPPGEGVRARPAMLTTTYQDFVRAETLREECFGPSVVVVLCDQPEQFIQAAHAINGSLTGTIWMDQGSEAERMLAGRLAAALERKVGRLIFDGVPTGVEVVGAMVHGGPYPATNQPHTSAVGTLAIRRWCRPVCFQNCPPHLLPDELADSNPRRIPRTEDGRLVVP